MEQNKVGTKFRTKIALMGNKPGTIGFAYEAYQDFDDKEKLGVSIVFENGETCGFSAEEQETMLEVIGFEEDYSGYVFEHVMKVNRDFISGYWKFI